jgi:hypothetical protein
MRGSVLSLSFMEPNNRDRPKKPDRPDPRNAPQMGPNTDFFPIPPIELVRASLTF